VRSATISAASEGTGSTPSSAATTLRNFTGSVMRSTAELAILRLSTRGSHSVPGIGIVTGAGASPCSNTGGTYDPP
jgi:hypothetical protein